MKRDQDVFDDIAVRLRDTDAFLDVYQAHPTQDGAEARGDTAWVQPLDWDELDHRQDPDGAEVTHHAHFTLTLAVRDGDPAERDRRLDQLAGIALNALDGQSLADLTLPGLTAIRKAKWEDPALPERRLTLTGEFAYFVPAPDAHGIDL